MSSLNPTPPPNNDAEWARDVEKRLRQLESSNTTRIGPWVISSQDEKLVATKPGESVELGQVPDVTSVSDVTRGFVTDSINEATANLPTTQDVTDAIDEATASLPTQSDIDDAVSGLPTTVEVDQSIFDIKNDITTSINPNGGTGVYIPAIKDYLNGKWTDVTNVTEITDTRMKAGNNLVSNPGFEKSSTLFVMGNAARDTAVARTGSASARMVASNSPIKLNLICNASGQTTITCTAGDIFYAECWVYGATTNNQSTGGGNGFSFYFDVFNRQGTKLGNSLTFTGPTASTSLNGQWTRFYNYIVIPKDATYSTAASFTAYIQMNTTVIQGHTYYFDDPIIRVDSLVDGWNYLFDGANGTSGNTGKGPFDLLTPLKNSRDLGSNAGILGGNIVDTLVNGLKALVGTATGWAYTDAENAARGIAKSISDLNATTANLLAAKEAGMFYGTAANETFNTYATGALSLSGKWSVITSTGLGGSGSSTYLVGTDVWLNKVVQWTPATGSFLRTAKAFYSTNTETQYQKIALVLNGIGGASRNEVEGEQYTYIYGRVNAARTAYVFARLGKSKATIGYNIGAGDVALTAPGGQQVEVTYTPKAGATYWLECGTGSTAARTYRLWEGSSVLTSWVDSGAVSPNSIVDSLGAGFGGYVGSTTGTPASIAGFGVYDNVPPTYRGSGFRANNVTVASNPAVGLGTTWFNPTQNLTGDGNFPSNWFKQEYCTDDLLYNELTNTLTVSQPGWYHVNIQQKGNYPVFDLVNTTARMAASVRVNTGDGVFRPKQIGPENAQSGLMQSFGASFVIYLTGGNQIRPGYYASATRTRTNEIAYTGGAAGTETQFTVTFLHNQLTKITTT